MATPSSILAWRIPWTEKPGGGGYSSWGHIESDVTEYAGTTALSLWMGNGGVGGAVINTSMV